MSGTAYAVPHATTCDGAGLSGSRLVGSDRGAAASSEAGSGTLSADKRAWVVTVNKGWTGSGVVINRGQSIETYKAEYVGPTTVRSDQGSTVLNTNILSPVTSWYLCGARSSADAKAEPPADPGPQARMIAPPPGWPKDAPFGSTSGQPPQQPQAPQPAQAPQEPNAQAPNAKAGQQPGAPAANPDEWSPVIGGQVNARPAAERPAAARPAARDEELPVTGVPAGLLAAAGVVFVAAGVGLLYSVRRRES